MARLSDNPEEQKKQEEEILKKLAEDDFAKKHTIESLFKKYLKLSDLDSRRMPPVQVRETRRAFYAAVGMLIIFQRDVLGKKSDKEAIKCLERFLIEVGEYYKLQDAVQNPKQN